MRYKKLFTTLLILGCLIYIGYSYYNSDNVKFKRYLNQITSINRTEVLAVDVSMSKNEIQFLSYHDDEDALLMLELLHEIKSLEELPKYNEIDEFTYKIRNAIETNNNGFRILLEVNTNYDFKIIEIDVDKKRNNAIISMPNEVKVTKYLKASDKSTKIIKELMNLK